MPCQETEAVKWLKLAADQGHPAACAHLGRLLRDGIGGPQDHQAAAGYFLKGALDGEPYAQLCLGNLYLHGLGVTTNHQAAFYWYSKSAEQGFSVAPVALGYMYQYGLGVELDLVKSQMWYLIGDESTPHRDLVEQMLTQEQRTNADKLAKEWRRTHQNRIGMYLKSLNTENIPR